MTNYFAVIVATHLDYFTSYILMTRSKLSYTYCG